MTKQLGTITQIVGVVIDVEFKGDLPAIYDALIITGDTTVTLEVAQHLDENTVRAIALSSTDGLKRGQEVEAASEEKRRQGQKRKEGEGQKGQGGQGQGQG